MDKADLKPKGPASEGSTRGDRPIYTLAQIAEKIWDWDKVVKGTHQVNCWYNLGCPFNVYVKNGVVLREEQSGAMPPPNDPDVPDANPRGCQKGVSHSHRMYDPSRIRQPLKRVGERGEGRWQPVSWEQALTEIADTMLDVLISEGNEAVLSIRGTHAAYSIHQSIYALEAALDLPPFMFSTEMGDDFAGAALTWGKIEVGDSADNRFFADMIFVWGCNPAYTHITGFHYIPEARYHGTRVVAISPDYNASAPFADTWVPVNIGSDAALALAMAETITRKGLHKADFVREQTDLPLLVRRDNGKLLRQKDLRRGGQEDIFYFYDERTRQVVEAPRKSLDLEGRTPALEGEYEVNALRGRVKVTPVFQLLLEHLRQYTPERASRITGVSPQVIEQLAVDFATAKGVVNVVSANWGKFYHGDLIERALILLWALCGHFGRKGAHFGTYHMLVPDTSVGYLQRRGGDAFASAEAADPRFSTWRQQGYTDEMILHEYASEGFARNPCATLSLMAHFHAGVQELAYKTNGWDPYLKRPLQEYVAESLKRKWQWAVPRPEKEPRIIIERGGNFLRRSRATNYLLRNLLPKLKMLISVDFRMGSTALYADYVLPCASSYERTLAGYTTQMHPYMHVENKAVEPLGEAKSEWDVYVLMAEKIQERARERGIRSFAGRNGQEVRLDNLYDRVTAQGLYGVGDEEAVARDYCLNASNLEKMEWEDMKEKGLVAFTGLGKSFPAAACDVVPGETIVPFTRHIQDKQPYPTMTRRMQFYIDHDWFLELGEALPSHKEPPPMGGNYPLQITGGHARWSIHSLWKDSPLLLRLQRGEPIMFMSMADARSRSVQDGDRVRVFNDVASIELQAVVSAAVRPGQVIIYHDWENFMFKGKRHFKSLMPSCINPIEMVGDYGHIRPRLFPFYSATPGGHDRGTRVEVAKLTTER